MATVFRSHRRYRVILYSSDHPPPHVHVLGKGLEARYVLGCPDGPVDLWDHRGTWSLAHLNELRGEISARLTHCCALWSEIHG